MSRAAADQDTSKALARAALRPILWLGTLAAIGTFLFADDAIAIAYGQQHFGPSGIILKVYAPALLLLFINLLLGNAIFELHRAHAFSVVKVTSVVISAALEYVGNGGIGVAAAFVVSEFVVFAGAIFLLRREGVGLGISVDMARALGSAALICSSFGGCRRSRSLLALLCA